MAVVTLLNYTPFLELYNSSIPIRTFPRDETVRELAGNLQGRQNRLFCGIPGSGKTQLARELYNYLLFQSFKVVLIWNFDPSGFTNITNITEYLLWHVEFEGFRSSANTMWSDDIIFIIDEAHKSYGCDEFWHWVNKCNDERMEGFMVPSFWLFSNYGPSAMVTSPNNGEGNMDRPIIPFPEDLSLHYDLGECMRAIDLYLEKMGDEYEIDNATRGYVFDLTNGHPRLVNWILEFVNELYHAHFKRAGIRMLGVGELDEALSSSGVLEGHLRAAAFNTGLPMVGTGLFPPTAEFRVLINAVAGGEEGLPWDASNEAMRACIRNGWLAIKSHARGVGGLKCQFPTPLHRRVVKFLVAVANGHLEVHGADGANALLMLGMEGMDL
ncbi:hypothetical protein N7467_001760 [Penicillium canescens]|nr:hypothetical protein N7467_001760 [Penicillium canescens]